MDVRRRKRIYLDAVTFCRIDRLATGFPNQSHFDEHPLVRCLAVELTPAGATGQKNEGSKGSKITA